MEVLFFAFAVALFFAPVVLGVVAILRAGAARRQMEQLEAELIRSKIEAGHLQNRLALLERRIEDLARRATSSAPGAPGTVPATEAPRAPSPVEEAPPDVGSRRATPELTAAPDTNVAAPDVESAPPTDGPPPREEIRESRDDISPSPGDVPPPPSDIPPPRVPSTAPPSFGWEQLLGVRGAAVLGGVVLALAAILFFQYSIEQGLIPPPVRVALAIFLGLGCIIGSERLVARYAITANAIAGGGAVALYGAFWAAKVLYDLVPGWLAFGLMGLTTATCCLLSVRRSSLLVAVLGLVGGFVTPPLLASGEDRPIGLFAYVLLLDAGLLYVAARRNWNILSLLSLVATGLLQAVWIRERMGEDRVWLGVGIVAVFAIAFTFGVRGKNDGSRAALPARAGGILLPYAFGLYFASNATLHVPIVALALLLGVLGGGAGFVGATMNIPALPIAGASATVAIVAVWLVQKPLDSTHAWQASVCSAALALVYHLFVELHGRKRAARAADLAALVAEFGLVGALILGAWSSYVPSLWPWLTGYVLLVASIYRTADLAELPLAQVGGAALLGIAMFVYRSTYADRDGFPGFSEYSLVEVALAASALAVALARRQTAAGKHAAHAAATLSATLLAGAATLASRSVPPELALGAPALVALCGIFAATPAGLGSWLCALGALLAFGHDAWTDLVPFSASDVPSTWAPRALTLQGACVVALAFYPKLAGDRFRGSKAAFYAAALAGAAWFTPLRKLYVECFGAASIGVLPVLLGAVELSSLASTRRIWPPDDPVRHSAMTWFSAVALGFVSVAIPLQLHDHWITVGWALEGAAVAALWVRLDHPGLKFVAGALYVLCTARLLLLAAELGDYDRGTNRILNFTLYTYWVPALSMFAGSRWLLPMEVERARPREKPLYAKRQPVVGIVAAGCALLVVFVWLNVAIADWFSQATHVYISFERQSARDLATSLAWAVYASALLAAGTRWSSRGLRAVSLAVLLLTIGKVFLYDLSNLHDLYRVMSLLGLAVSLIGVSLAYQRFVFRAPTKEGRP